MSGGTGCGVGGGGCDGEFRHRDGECAKCGMQGVRYFRKPLARPMFVPESLRR